MKTEAPFISIIIPCRNEEKFIATVLANILAQDYPMELIEVFVVDGNSTDSTKNIAMSFSKEFRELYILNNPHKTVPFALNLAIKKTKGKFIIRMDAHTNYANDYVNKIVETFQSTNADVVGGPMRAEGKTDFQKAVAYCTSTKMGVGDSSFHDETVRGYVDSVYLGAWKRELFNDVGMFDEQMKRNQDDEFHYRAKSRGKKIYLNPEIRSVYYPRTTAKKLFIQYFQYGLYKPLVLKKIKREIKWRHIIPSVFVFYLLSLFLLISMNIKIAIIPLLLYILLSSYFSLSNNLSVKSKCNCFIIYPILHISYGAGFLAGLLKK